MKNWIFVLVFTGSLAIFGCNTNNVTQDDSLKKHFDDAGVTGTFGIFDNAQGQFTIYNLTRFRDSAYLPASTFKIFNSLAALGTGVIFSDTVVVPWDKVVRTGPGGDTMHAWNKDMNMQEAFRVSNVGFYQEMARRIGKDSMQLLLDSLGYGRRYDTFRIGDNLDKFWLDNTFKVTADEQLGLVKKLYFRQLPFQNREQEIVRNMMIQERNDKYILAYKTGWGQLENGNQLGWVVGWIEENKHIYPFSLNIESKEANPDFATIRLNLLKNILKQLGFFEGRK
jgi:beta-lactamase class D